MRFIKQKGSYPPWRTEVRVLLPQLQKTVLKKMVFSTLLGFSFPKNPLSNPKKADQNVLISPYNFLAKFKVLDEIKKL